MITRTGFINSPSDNSKSEDACILVDEQDNALGPCAKTDCHSGAGKLHRAFSILLFNSKNELLIQKRSAQKVTFPGAWANSCCSHPRYLPEEMDTKDAAGIKRAAIRRMKQELGITNVALSIDQLRLMTRLHYQAQSDTHWSEHEIDYLLVVQGDFTLQPNPEEVAEVRWVTPGELTTLLEKDGTNNTIIAPWFLEIATHFLPRWWNNLDRLDKQQDTLIHCAKGG